MCPSRVRRRYISSRQVKRSPAAIEPKSNGVWRHPAGLTCSLGTSHPHSQVGCCRAAAVPPLYTASGSGRQTGGGRGGLITAPETHQRHPAPALCLSSKLPAKGGSAPALHLVSFYGNRKQLLVGDGEAEAKGAGGEGNGEGGEGAIHNFCSLPEAPARGRDGEEEPKKPAGGGC